MIFVTVGTQLPFDRLIDAMQDYAAAQGEEVVAQTGHVPSGDRWPALDARAALSPDQFGDLMRTARIVVGHAGIGTVLSATRFARPLVILPRRADLGEHRNDHQMATARQLEGRRGLSVAWDATAIRPLLSRDAPAPMGGDHQSPETGDFLRRLAGLLAD